jgi:tRNA (guanine37-N1)-methyltransferase
MNYHIISLFPVSCKAYLETSILGRAQEDKLISISYYDLRKYTKDKHRRTDGKAYGGGPGMVLWVDPIINCVNSIDAAISKKYLKSLTLKKNIGIKIKKPKILYVLFTPEKVEFTNQLAKDVAGKYSDIVFICGRYEGVDARVRQILGAVEWSVGPYVLTGGEIPAMICVDAISRQIKGVLHDENSIEENRISSHDVYARPEVYEYKKKTKSKTGEEKVRIVKYKVPEVLLSGNHKLIDEWRLKN